MQIRDLPHCHTALSSAVPYVMCKGAYCTSPYQTAYPQLQYCISYHREIEESETFLHGRHVATLRSLKNITSINRHTLDCTLLYTVRWFQSSKGGAHTHTHTDTHTHTTHTTQTTYTHKHTYTRARAKVNQRVK